MQNWIFASRKSIAYRVCLDTPLTNKRIGKRIKIRSRPISRVLSRAAIHLGRASPFASSNLPRNSCGHTKRSSIRSCSGWGLPCHRCRHLCGALLPHHFTLTGLLRPAVYFLWHFPWAYAPQELPGTLPNGARTFLQGFPQRLPGRLLSTRLPEASLIARR